MPIECFHEVYYKNRGKAYRLGHCKECANQASRDNYAKYRERRLQSKKDHYSNNPWRIRLGALLARCSEGYVELNELQAMVEAAGDRCCYCGQSMNGSFTFDHALPVSLGGTNDPENLRVCCLSCNSKKGNKTEYTYRIELNGAPF
jgi:5-methylcytosine-specific restriction endonuclease McrA